jgi:hypothetical protein
MKLLKSWMKQDFHSGIERKVKTLNKIYRSVILQFSFQNVGTVVVKVFKGSKTIEFKKEYWIIVHCGKGDFEMKKKVKIPKKILMGTEKVISVKSGIRYKHTQKWRHTLLMGYEMNNLSRNLEKMRITLWNGTSSKTGVFTDIVMRTDGKDVYQLLRTMTRKYLPAAFWIYICFRMGRCGVCIWFMSSTVFLLQL